MVCLQGLLFAHNFLIALAQSNFMAPFDFIIADGRVIRQAYAKEMDMWAFPKKGTLCWAMQVILPDWRAS